MPATTTQTASVPYLTLTDQMNQAEIDNAIARAKDGRRKPPTGFMCESETIKAGEILAVRNVCRWIQRPTPLAVGWERGILQINGTNYFVSCQFDQLDDGSVFQIIDLRKSDGKHIRVILGAQETCDCEAATYRPGAVCKHVKAVKSALVWLEERQRMEWEAEVARRDVARHPSVSTF